MQKLMFSRKQEGAIGSFDYGLGLVSLRRSAESAAVMRDPALIAQFDDDPAARLKVLLEVTAEVHERRHYLDTFGTVAGISVYTARLACIKRFIATGFSLRQSGVRWQLPLSDWVRRPDCPKVVRDLARAVRSHGYGMDAFFADYERVALDGHGEAAWLNVPVPVTGAASANVVPTYPMSTTIQALVGGKPTDEARPITVFFPLGYELLMEGAAHTLARDIVGMLFPSVDPHFLVQYGPPPVMRPLADDDAYLQQAADAMSPYAVTDLLISKYLRSRGVPRFPRKLVRLLTDIALSGSFMHLSDLDDKSTKVEMLSPALKFIAALEGATVEELRSGTVAYPAATEQVYAAIIKQLGEGGDWDAVAEPGSIYSAVSVWESFLAHHVTLPLLRRRLETAHASFYDGEQSMKQVLDETLPVVQVVNEQIDFKHIPKPVQLAWVRQMMAGEIAHQVFSDARVILCPRKHHLLPGMTTLDLSGGHCGKHARRGCGSWQAGKEQYLPECIFTESLRACGLAQD